MITLRNVMLVLLLFTLMLTGSVQAQYYDTVHRPNVTWHELNTRHFRIIYHEGFESTARRAAQLLEDDYDAIQELVGGSLRNFPVIINGYNDLSNGYVSSFNFRMEVEAPPIGGKILNPRTGGHLDNLMSHELVHALQFSVRGGYTSILYLFSPDLGRSVHGFVPGGMIEGFAVLRESQLTEGGGRGNFAPFMHQYYGNLSSDRPWRLAHHMTPASFSRPGGRHYIGGYVFTHWLAETQGTDVLRRSISSHARFPLLGYPVNLWAVTGMSPWKMAREFNADITEREQERLEAHRLRGSQFVEPVDMGRLRGPDVHQPRWISNTEVLYYGRFYNQRSGFWVYDTETGRHRLLKATSIHESMGYDVDRERGTLLYARYTRHPYHENRFTADLHELNLADGEAARLTEGLRTHGAVYRGGGMFALQTDRHTYRWIHIDENQQVEPVLVAYPAYVVQVAVSPLDENLVAVIANTNGVQGLWLLRMDETDPSSDPILLRQSPDIAFGGGAVYDAHWHPTQPRLLLSGEHEHTLSIFEYHYTTDRLYQLTRSPYNTMEAAYTPSGNGIAMVVQHQNYRRLALLDSTRYLNHEVPRHVWQPNLQHLLSAPPPQLSAMRSQPYRTGAAWLRPRAIIPTAKVMSARGTNSYGVITGSADVLRRNAYSLELTYGAGELYYDFQYTYAGRFPKIQAGSSLRPFVPGAPVNDQTDLYGQERIQSLSLPMSWYLDDPAGTTGFFLQPEIQLNSARALLRPIGSSAILATSDWNTALRARMQVTYAHRLRQHMRDIQPNSGVRLYMQGDYDLYTSDQVNPFTGFRTGVQTWVAPRLLQNESLRLELGFIRQNRFGYNLFGIVHEGFDIAGIGFSSPNLSIFSTRYTLPISYPERGGYLIPVFIDRIYAVIFTETIGSNFFEGSQTLVGGGIRAQIRLVFNFPVDIGIGVATIPGTSGSHGVLTNF